MRRGLLILMCFFRCSCRQYCSRDSVNLSGCGAVGSALPWGGRGRKFKSCHSDQIKPKTNRFRLYFLHFRGKIERFPTTFAPPEIPKIFWPHVWPQLERKLLISAISCVIMKLPNSKVPNVFGALRRWCSWKPFLRRLWYFAGRKSSMNKSAPKRHRGSPPSAMKYSVR